MRQMWHSAVAWGYVQHDHFFGILLPDRGLVQERFLSLDEMKCIIEAAREPYKTYYWILAETGVRAGEIGALPVSNLLLDHGAIRITQNAWHGKPRTAGRLLTHSRITPYQIEVFSLQSRKQAVQGT